MDKIILTELEEKMLALNVSREFFPGNCTKEEAKAMISVISKAEALMAELDAYDEMGDSLMEWFQAKYKAQQESDAEKAAETASDGL